MTRRRDSRLEIANTEGVLRVLRDVTVNRTDDGDFIVIGSEAGTPGEVLTIQIAADGNRPVLVRVTDSYPTIIGGRVRHELRLMPFNREVVQAPMAARDRSSEGE